MFIATGENCSNKSTLKHLEGLEKAAWKQPLLHLAAAAEVWFAKNKRGRSSGDVGSFNQHKRVVSAGASQSKRPSEKLSNQPCLDCKPNHRRKSNGSKKLGVSLV